jgi:outer membrane lipoprotein LolB
VTDCRKLLFFHIFLLLTGLSGCQSLPAPAPGPGSFSLKGKVAVSEGGERFSANLLWQQDAEDFRIDLWGPLGQGRVRLVKQGQEVRLESTAGEVLAEGESERVMREQLGWSLPVAVLPAWVQGRPLAGVAAEDVRYDEAGRITAFRQLGWAVALEGYQTLSGELGARSLPSRVKALSDTASVRLVVSAWEI